MKNQKRLSDLSSMTSVELETELLKSKKEQFNLRFQKSSGSVTNTARIREVRREIARIKTLQSNNSKAMSTSQGIL